MDGVRNCLVYEIQLTLCFSVLLFFSHVSLPVFAQVLFSRPSPKIVVSFDLSASSRWNSVDSPTR